MKRIILFSVIIFIGCAENVMSQARRELNFGLVGVSYEIPVYKDITIAPGASTNFDLNWFTANVKGNYYFDNLVGLTNESWDVYAGAGAGYAFYIGNEDKSSNFDIGLHAGGRWFWNEKWGVYLELGGASTQGATGGIGLTVKL